MVHITPIFAEVGDKEPTVLAIWVISWLFCIGGLATARWRRTAALVPITLAVLWALAVSFELRDPYAGPAILEELGRGYAVQAYTVTVLPFLFITGGFFLRRSDHPGGASSVGIKN